MCIRDRYKAFEMYFMQGMDYAEIAEELDTGKNTPRRWVTGIINELSVLLLSVSYTHLDVYKRQHCYERRLCSLMGHENCCTASACTAAYKRDYEYALSRIREWQET